MNCRKCKRSVTEKELPKKKDGGVKEVICRRCQAERRYRRFEFYPEKHSQYLDYLRKWRQENRKTA